MEEWLTSWRERLREESLDAGTATERLRAVNPALIPRNHRVELAITRAEDEADFGPFHRLVDLLEAPFAADADAAPEARPPRPEERVTQTFCGT